MHNHIVHNMKNVNSTDEEFCGCFMQTSTDTYIATYVCGPFAHYRSLRGLRYKNVDVELHIIIVLKVYTDACTSILTEEDI